MGQKNSSRTTEVASAGKPLFKLLEYSCPRCKGKRQIQYFYRGDSFIPQNPRVVCGGCNTSVTVEPFKTVSYECPSCRKWQKARVPGRPIRLNMYNRSVVSCNCGFKGEVAVGRVMDITCCKCWHYHRALCDVWADDNEEMEVFCAHCQEHQRAFAQDPKARKEVEQRADLEYRCENCHRVRTAQADELLRTEGLASCSLCHWVGYPQVHAKGHFEKMERQREARRDAGDGQAASTSSRARRPIVERPILPSEVETLSPIVPSPLLPT
mmetsp:Transcript_68775/g.199535  ORF Transcript_68775/g.199535 Transcript_68775/m.199535 type:complete len:268 (+) Transcript_68775:113-916(+)